MVDQKILLTFDYELFLGRNSGSVENCLIVPTREILARLRGRSASAIFFVDATYLSKIEASEKESYAKVAGQIEEMIGSGCEVGFHLHPHWLDAVRVGEKVWSLENTSKYRLHALEVSELQRVFGQSMDSLTRAVRRASRSYRINTFRAGGWCLQPFSSLKKSFEEFGIEYDFSVTSGLYKNSPPAHFYDYRNAPKDRAAWRFVDDPCVPQEEGKFIEVPVTAFKATLADLVANNLRIRGQQIFGDGQGIGGGRLRELVRKTFAGERVRQLTLDMCSSEMLQKSLNKTKECTIRVFASHPKIFSQNSLLNLDVLLNNHKTLRSSEILRYA